MSFIMRFRYAPRKYMSLTDFSSEKLNGHASSKNKVPQNIVKVYGQSETEIINEGGLSSLSLYFDNEIEPVKFNGVNKQP